MFGGKFQNVWREAKKWQRRVASFFVDRIPYGKFENFRKNREFEQETTSEHVVSEQAIISAGTFEELRQTYRLVRLQAYTALVRNRLNFKF